MDVCLLGIEQHGIDFIVLSATFSREIKTFNRMASKMLWQLPPSALELVPFSANVTSMKVVKREDLHPNFIVLSTSPFLSSRSVRFHRFHPILTQ